MENMYKMLEKDPNLLWVCINQIIISLKPISIHQNILIKYATILAYYPMKESKMEIFIKLDKKQKVGMLSRHIMGVASKLGIYQTLLKEIINLKQSHRTARKYIKPKPKKRTFFKEDKRDDFWEKVYVDTQSKLNYHFLLLLDIIIEEINRRHNLKYLRKKKLEEILQN